MSPTASRIARLSILLLAVGMLCGASSAFLIDGATFATGYSHTVNGISGTTLTYYHIPYILSNSTGDPSGNVIYTDGSTQPDWSDIRFTSDSNTIYPHWIESTNTTCAAVWVNVTQIPEAGTTMRCYYDSDTAVQASNGTATFPLFDDFIGAAINTGHWGGDVAGTNVNTVSGGILRQYTNADSTTGLLSTTTYDQGHSVRMRVRLANKGYYYGWGWKTSGVINAGTAWNAEMFEGANSLTIYNYLRDGNTAANQGSTVIGSTATYYTYEIPRNAGNAMFYVDNVNVTGSTARSHDPTGALPVALGIGNGYSSALDVYTDWVFVRKDILTEPAHGAYSEIVAPVANFSSNTTTGKAPLTVAFTDESTGSPTAWAWDFDGDAVADSTDQNPAHEYAANGNYSVTLQVSNAGGTDLETKTNYIYVGPLTATYLKASFRYVAAAGIAPHTVTFTDTTKANGSYTRSWNFGDGETSNEANPVHVYTNAGEYDVSLTVQSDSRRNTETYKKIIKAYPVAAGSPLPTNTYGVHMTEIMDSNWNISVIGAIMPKAYTDIMPETLFYGLLFVGVFLILFVRQGTSWLVALLGIIIGGNVLIFLPPEFQSLGQAMLIISIGAFLYVMIMGRIRSN